MCVCVIAGREMPSRKTGVSNTKQSECVHTVSGVSVGWTRWPSKRNRTDCSVLPCRSQNAFINFSSLVERLILKNTSLLLSVTLMLRCSAPAGACSAFGEPFSWLSDIVVVVVDTSGVTVLVRNDDQVRVAAGLLVVVVLVVVDVVVQGRLLDSVGVLTGLSLAGLVDGEADSDCEREQDENEEIGRDAVERESAWATSLILVVACNHFGRQSFVNAVG